MRAYSEDSPTASIKNSIANQHMGLLQAIAIYEKLSYQHSITKTLLNGVIDGIKLACEILTAQLRIIEMQEQAHVKHANNTKQALEALINELDRAEEIQENDPRLKQLTHLQKKLNQQATLLMMRVQTIAKLFITTHVATNTSTKKTESSADVEKLLKLDPAITKAEVHVFDNTLSETQLNSYCELRKSLLLRRLAITTATEKLDLNSHPHNAAILFAIEQISTLLAQPSDELEYYDSDDENAYSEAALSYAQTIINNLDKLLAPKAETQAKPHMESKGTDSSRLSAGAQAGITVVSINTAAPADGATAGTGPGGACAAKSKPTA